MLLQSIIYDLEKDLTDTATINALADYLVDEATLNWPTVPGLPDWFRLVWCRNVSLKDKKRLVTHITATRISKVGAIVGISKYLTDMCGFIAYSKIVRTLPPKSISVHSWMYKLGRIISNSNQDDWLSVICIYLDNPDDCEVVGYDPFQLSKHLMCLLKIPVSHVGDNLVVFKPTKMPDPKYLREFKERIVRLNDILS